MSIFFSFFCNVKQKLLLSKYIYYTNCALYLSFLCPFFMYFPKKYYVISSALILHQTWRKCLNPCWCHQWMMCHEKWYGGHEQRERGSAPNDDQCLLSNTILTSTIDILWNGIEQTNNENHTCKTCHKEINLKYESSFRALD